LGITHRGVIDGTFKAEQCLLALLLSERDERETVRQFLQDEVFLTPAHQRIKKTIDAIGSNFNNLEDLVHKLRERLALENGDNETTAALFQVIERGEEVSAQKGSVEQLVTDLRIKLITERVNLAKSRLSSLSMGKEDSEQADLQSKIRELTGIGRKLPSLNNLSEIGDLQRKIEEIIAPYEAVPNTETRV
jgi:hypothetical protein